jgi:aldehyde dehydrogenase (NAD+)
VPETQAILKQRFDHILYTGAAAVAKIISRAAAEFLTPVTLELGGKSPVIIEEGADVAVAARRITWGRFLNCGQTCIAPDYVLCSKKTEAALLPAIAATLKEFYGDDIKSSPDYARVINERHFQRVKALMDEGTIAIGGTTDEAENYIEPTVITDVTEESPSMKEEIFGPVLPIFTMDTVDGAIAFINKRDKPLALYMFSNTKASIEKVLTQTSSGGAVVNDTMMHAAVSALPFGGVGMSGMGGYHGKHSFDLFSHQKAVMIKSLGLEFVNKVRYPPYSDKTAATLEKFVGVHPKNDGCVIC